VKVVFPKYLILLKLAPQNEKGPWGVCPTALLSGCIYKKNREALDEARHGLLVYDIAAGSKSGRHTSSV